MKNQADKFSFPSQFKKAAPFVWKAAKSILAITRVSSVSIIYFLEGEWHQAGAGFHLPKAALENIIFRRLIKEGRFIEIPDALNDPSCKFIVLETGPPMIRYISAVPVFINDTPAGAVMLTDLKRNCLTDALVMEVEKHSRRIGRHLNTL